MHACRGALPVGEGPVGAVSADGSWSLDFCGFCPFLAAIGSGFADLSIASDNFFENPLSVEDLLTVCPDPAPLMGNCGKTEAMGKFAVMSLGMDTDISIFSFTSFLRGPCFISFLS